MVEDMFTPITGELLSVWQKTVDVLMKLIKDNLPQLLLIVGLVILIDVAITILKNILLGDDEDALKSEFTDDFYGKYHDLY